MDKVKHFFSSPLSKKICPVYHNEMICGYIQCRDSLYWHTDIRFAASLPPIKRGGIRLPAESGGGPFRGRVICGYNCPKCKTITIFCDDSDNFSD